MRTILLSYVDGTWSDRIAARRVDVRTHGSETLLTVELAAGAKARNPHARSAALRELAEKQFSIDSLQVMRPSVVARLREELRHAANIVIRVRLLGPGVEVDYPGCARFGPDAITLTFG